MMYYEDLGTETMIAAGRHIRAVGWLEPSHSFTHGDTLRDFRNRLRDLSNDWSESSRVCGWPVAGGSHLCGFCGKVRGHGEFGIPSDTKLYVAPMLISHYVEVHGYRPPTEFIEAVLNCPVFSSVDYKSRVASVASS